MNDNRLNVVHVIPSFFRAGDGILGGAERYAFELARNMANTVPTTLISFGDSYSEDSFGALKVKLLGDAHYVRGQRTKTNSRTRRGNVRKTMGTGRRKVDKK